MNGMKSLYKSILEVSVNIWLKFQSRGWPNNLFHSSSQTNGWKEYSKWIISILLISLLLNEGISVPPKK